VRSDANAEIRELAEREYEWGFTTEVEQDTLAPGLDERVIRLISAKKEEPAWLLEWRLRAFRRWLEMREEDARWAKVRFPPIDYQAISYYSAPRRGAKYQSLDEVDPEIRQTFDKLGIPLEEQKLLAGVAVDAVFDSVSVATTFKSKLAELGIVFCSMSEAVREHPELVQSYLGSVVPYSDNFFATLNSAVFTDGSFVYVPEGVRCPMELSTYFRINEQNTGQFERTLIVADAGAYVSYLEGCTAPRRDENQLHAAVVELVALEGAQIKYSTVQNWYPGDREGRGGIYNFVTSAAPAAGAAPGSPGRRWRPAPRSPGSTRAASCRVRARSASSTRSRSPTISSRRTPAPRWSTWGGTPGARSCPRGSPPAGVSRPTAAWSRSTSAREAHATSRSATRS
jgi:Fe-S cluster assembly protein SufB